MSIFNHWVAYPNMFGKALQPKLHKHLPPACQPSCKCQGLRNLVKQSCAPPPAKETIWEMRLNEGDPDREDVELLDKRK